MSRMEHGTDIQCDDCLNWVNVARRTATAARKELKGMGWEVWYESRGIARDRCPACVALKGQEKKSEPALKGREGSEE